MRRVRRKTNRIGIVLLVGILFWQSIVGTVSAEQEVSGSAADDISATSQMTYRTYLQQYTDKISPQTTIFIPLENYSASQNNGAEMTDDLLLEGNPVLKTGETGYVEWKFSVEQEGLYNLSMDYYPIEGKGASIVRKLFIDGKVPFEECKNLTFSRSFQNKDEIQTDESGNQIRPQQEEKPRWLRTDYYDHIGYYQDPLCFYLTQGTHIIRLESVREPLAIGSLKFYQVRKPQKYQAPARADDSSGYIRIQGEDADYKSDNLVYPINDKSSPATDPSSYDTILLNVIGGTKWQNNGQWLEWNFNITQAGYYKIGIKFRQNVNAGQASYRKVYLDGEVPCEELNSVSFPYNSKWQTKVLGDGKQDFYFYLAAGEHQIKLEVVLGELSDLVQEVNDSITRLNQIYRNLLMIIGKNPDTGRDYQFQKTSSAEIQGLKDECQRLRKIYDRFTQLNDMGGYQSQILETIIDLTDQMSSKPDKIAKMFGTYADNISSLGNWLTTAKSQPLEIDFIEIATHEKQFASPSAGWFSYLSFVWNQFIASFVVDYNAIGTMGTNNKTVSVWLSTGRDQANALNQMASNYFTAETGIGVNLQLVAANTLLTATLAGKGPDVALSMSQSDPMNYAIRGAVKDISGMEGFAEVKKRFQESAMTPLTFDGKVYGLPETQTFPMMFYREDILQQLGLEVPQTWEDVIAMLPVLQKKNLNFALPLPMSTTAVGVGLPVYATLFYQLGGKFYNEDSTATVLDTSMAAEAFEQWVSFYNDYSLPSQFDFNTRFRSGEIPIGIADYGTYNALSVFAPELNGIWKFAPIPGIRMEDGTINRTAASSITASVIMNGAKDVDSAWEFLKWWTSAKTQEDYGKELESIMGTAARYQTANVEALYHIPWNTEDFDTLMIQWKQTKGIPEIPGSYMTSRYIDFAFKQMVVNGAEDSGRALLDAARLIDNEITAKREEFGLS